MAMMTARVAAQNEMSDADEGWVGVGRAAGDDCEGMMPFEGDSS
jgi:hypothetical protein